MLARHVQKNVMPVQQNAKENQEWNNAKNYARLVPKHVENVRKHVGT